MSSRLTTAAVTVLIAVGLFATTADANASSCGPAATLPPEASQPIAQRQALACLINEVRAEHHLRALTSQGSLAGVAGRYSRRLVTGSFFAHVDAANHSTIESRGKPYTAGADIWALGENLAWATGYRSSPEQILAMWIASPGHRANLLDPQWKDVGIGIASGTPVGAAGATYAAEFGSKILKQRPHRSKHRRT